MQSDITRETWREAVRAERLTLPAVARLTKTNVRNVRAYADGSVRAPDDFVAKVATVLGILRALNQD